jgi:hypothetical protein
MSSPEVIVIYETVAQSVLKDAVSIAALSAAIGLGVVLNSPAMQWVAGIIWLVLVLSLSARAFKDNRMTVAKARKRLDEIEAA